MTNRTPVAASRFSLSIDGFQIASFTELQGITTKVAAKSEPRKLLAHELTHTVQQTAAIGPVSLIVRSADLGRLAVQRLRSATGRVLTLTATSARGAPVASYRGKLLAPDRSAKSESITIVCDHLQRVGV